MGSWIAFKDNCQENLLDKSLKNIQFDNLLNFVMGTEKIEDIEK